MWPVKTIKKNKTILRFLDACLAKCDGRRSYKPERDILNANRFTRSFWLLQC